MRVHSGGIGRLETKIPGWGSEGVLGGGWPTQPHHDFRSPRFPNPDFRIPNSVWRMGDLEYRTMRLVIAGVIPKQISG